MKLSAPIDLNTALSNASSKVDAAIANTNSSIANYNKTVPESLQQYIPDLSAPEETQQNALYTDADLRRMGTLGNVANFGAQAGTYIGSIPVGVAQLYHEVAGNIAAKRLDPLDQVALQAKLYGSDHATFAKNYQASLQAQIDDLTQSTDIDPAYKAAHLPALQAKLAAGVPTLNDYLHTQSADGSFGYDRIASAQDQYQSAQDSAALKKDIIGLANHAGQLERAKKLDEHQSLNDTAKPEDANVLGFAKYELGYLGRVVKNTLNNPAALSDDIAGSAAYVLGGAQRTVATKALGAFSQAALIEDGLNTLGEGIQATRLNNKESSISGAEAVTSVLGSAAYYALNKFGSDNTAKAIASVSPTLNAASLESRNILADALAKAGKVPGVTGATHLGQTALIEGSTEGAQTYFQDNVAKNNFSDVNLENILQATGVGAVMGGTLSTPAAVGNTFTLAKDKVKATQAQIDGSIEDNIDINNAAAYNPNMAVGKIAQQTVGIEDQDILAAHYADAQAVEAKAYEHLIDAQDQFKQLNVGLPERIAELQDTIDTNTDLLTQVPVDVVPQVQANIDQAQAELTQITSTNGQKIHAANIKAAQAKLDTIEQMVKDTSAQVTTFGRNIQSKADRAAAQEDQAKVDGIDLSTDAVAQRAVDQIAKQGKGDFQLDDSPEILHAKQDPRFNVQVNEDGDSYIAGVQTTDGYVGEKPVKAKAPVDLTETKKQIFTNPNSMAHDDIQSFIDNPDAPINDNERNALREFSAARQALQSRQNTSSVSQAVLKGADGFKGLNDHQSGISAAINSGNKKLAGQLTAQLTKFAAFQNKKAALARELYDAAVKKGTREKTRMVYTLQGDWVKDTGQFKNISRETNGALDIHKGSLNLIQAIEFDSKNINKAAAAFTTITKDAVADPSTAVPVKVQQARVAQTKLATNRQINTSKQVLPYEANSTYNTIRGVTVADPKAPSDRNIADVSTAVLGQALPKQQDFQFKPNETGDAAKFANTEMTLASHANKMISNSQVTSDSRGTTVVDQLKEHFGDQTNSNDFTADDVVYVSEPYNTKVTPETLSQVSAAIEAGATILMPPTFTQYGLSRSKRLNTQLKALRDISQVLREGGYSDYMGIGVWVKDSSKQATTATSKPVATKAPVAAQMAEVKPEAAQDDPYKERNEALKKPIADWNANDFSAAGMQAIPSNAAPMTLEQIDQENAFAQKMVKKIVTDGIARGRSTEDITHQIHSSVYSNNFAMKQGGVDTLHQYIEDQKKLSNQQHQAPTAPQPAPVAKPTQAIMVNLDSSEGWVKDPETKDGYIRHIKKVDENTKHIVITNEALITKENPQGIQKNEIRSNYTNIGTDDYGNSISWKIIRDGNNPDVVKRAEVTSGDKVTRVDAGNNKITDEQFIKDFSEPMDITFHDGVFPLKSNSTATKAPTAPQPAPVAKPAAPVQPKDTTVKELAKTLISYKGVEVNRPMLVGDFIKQLSFDLTDAHSKDMQELIDKLIGLVPDTRLMFYSEESPFNTSNKIEVGELNYLKDNPDVAATHNSNESLISIRTGQPDDKTIATIAHELIHSATANAVNLMYKEDKYPELKTHILGLMNSVMEEVYYDNAANNHSNMYQYSLSNMHEFLAVSRTDPDVMAYLKNLPADKTNLLQAIVDVVIKLLGLNKTEATIYDQMVNALAQTASINKQLAVDKLKEVITKPQAVQEQAAVTKAEPVVEAKPVTEMTDQEIQTELDASSTANTDGNEDLITERDIALYNEQQARDNVVQPITTDELKIPETIDGKLSVLTLSAEKLAEEKVKPLNKQNLVSTGFKQGTSNEAGNPLVKIKNLLSLLVGKTDPEIAVLLREYTQEDLTPAQLNLVGHFVEFAQTFNPMIERMLTTTFADRDVLHFQDNYAKYLLDNNQFLTNGEPNPSYGYLDENIQTAISLAAFTYVNDNQSNGFKTDEQLRQLLDLPEDASIPEGAFEYANLGDLVLQISSTSGAKILNALSLKLRDGDVPISRKAKLESALGTIMVKALQATNLVTETTKTRLDQLNFLASSMAEEDFDRFSAGVIADATDGAINQSYNDLTPEQRVIVEDKLKYRTISYMKVSTTKVDGIDVPSEAAQEIIDAFKDTKGILGTLFGVDSALITPSTAPQEHNQTSIKDTDRSVPQKLKDNINQSNKTGFTPRVAVHDLLKNLYENDLPTLKALLGIKDQAYLDALHITERRGTEAKWNAQLLGIKNALDYLSTLETNEADEYPEIFFNQIVHINQRLGYTANALNLQTNKAHRALVGLSVASTEVIPVKGGYSAGHLIDETSELTSEDLFMRSIAQGMEKIPVTIPGHVVSTVDRVAPEHYLPVFAEYINSDVVKAWSQSMWNVMQGKGTAEDTKAIQEAIDTFDSDELGMNSLIHLATYHQGKPFTHSLGLDSDGVTSGMIINNLGNGIISPEMSIQGGLFTKESGFTNFFQTKRAQLKDYYETMADAMDASFNNMMGTGVNLFSDIVNESILSIEPKLFSRSFAKVLATPFNYGAGIPKIKAAIAYAILGKSYKKMAKIAAMYKAGKPDAEANAKVLQSDLNNLIHTYNLMNLTGSKLFAYMDNLNLSKVDQDKALVGLLVARVNAKLNPTKTTGILLSGNILDELSGRQWAVDAMFSALGLKTKQDINTPAGFNKMLTHLSFATGKENFVPVDSVHLPTDPTELLDFRMDWKQQQAVMGAVGNTLGTTSGFAVAKVAEKYIAARDINSAGLAAAFTMHDQIKKAVTNEYLQFLIDTKAIDTDKDGHPLEGLSQNQLDEIDRRIKNKQAIVTTAMGTTAEGKPVLDAGISVTKRDVIYTKTPGNTQRIALRNPTDVNGKGSSTTVGIAQKVEVAPGVAPLALQTQSTDSAVSSNTGAAIPSLNLHDAQQFATQMAALGAQTQNENFYKLMSEYSFPVAIAKAMHNPLVATIKGFISSVYDTEKLADFPKFYQKIQPNDHVKLGYQEVHTALYALTDMLKKSFGTTDHNMMNAYINYAYQAELKKLNIMKEYAVIHQYAGARGEWTVSQEALDTLDKRIAQVKADHKLDLKHWNATSQALDIIATKTKFMYVPLREREEMRPIVDMMNRGTETDVNNQPRDQDKLDAQFDDFISKPAWQRPISLQHDGVKEDSLAGLEQSFVYQPNNYMKFIYTAIKNRIPDLKIVVVDTFSDVQDNDSDSIARYFYANHTIEINSAQLAKWTPQVLLHELVHAFTSQIINIGSVKRLTNPVAAKAYRDLESLFKAVKDHPDMQNGTYYGLTDLHEFLAEAFSNTAFQKKLAAIRVQPRGSKFITTAWRSFMDAVSTALGIPQRTDSMSALEAVMNITADLTTEQNVQQSMDKLTAQFVNPNMVAHVNGLSASELLDQVSSQSVSDSFMDHLRSIFTQTVDPLQEALGLQTLLADSSTQPNDVLMQRTIESGKAPYVSSMRDAGFLLSSEEAYAVESIEAAAFAALEAKSDTLAFKELFKTFEAAKEHLEAFDFHYGDWNQADDTQRKIAQAKYDLVFGASDNHYLSRFVALTLGSEEINKKLSIIPQAKESTEEVDVFKKILNAFSSMVDRFSGSIVGVRTSDVVAERVNTLLEQLTSIELRKRSDLQDKMMQGITDATNIGDSILGTRSLIARAAEKATDNVLLQAILAPAKLDTIGKSVKQLRDYNNPNQPLGIVAEAFREGSTSDKVQRRFELFARAATVMQRTRKEIIAATKKGLLNTFSEKGKYLKKEHHEAISYGLLRTDVQSIMDHYGIDRIKALYSNNAFRGKEIQDLERTILKNKNGNEFIHRTRDLAYNMIKQDTRIAQAKNAQQIASRVTVVKNPTIIPNDAQIVRDIDRLATLYAISELEADQRKLIVEMMTKEAKTGAIKYVINSHGAITADARTKLFSGNPLNMAKGYVPEITNPHKEFKVGANTPENIADMKLRGFNLHSTVKPHPQDPVEKEWALFISPDGGQQRFVSGQISLSTTHRKGTKAVGQADPNALSHVDNYTRSRALHTYKGDPLKYDPATAERGMVPAIDTQGNVIAYGYEMQAATRDALLERNNDFSDILGQYAGQIQDRMDSPKHNNEIMKALHEDFTDNYARNPHAYVDIGTRSTHLRLREIWAMLPQDTRFHAEELFGKGKPIYVRNDLITPIFGFNKISIGTMFDKHSGDRNLTEAITVAGFQMFFKDDPRLSAIRTQRGVMEAIGLLKDLIVIRNVTTMLHNLQANSVILTAFGINPIDMVKGIKTAIQGALLYTKYNALLLDAQQRLLAGDGDAKTHQENIIKYSDILDRNPVKDFIDAGMFSTIVEDIGAEDNHYTYLSVQQRKMKKFTDKVPNSIKTTFAYVAVSPETPMHKFLTNATSFSDFAAKYVLYTHLTTKAKDKKTPAEAMDIASDMFINYDIPTSRELQFMNDIGILMFTKYNIRIQKALVYLIRNHAGNVLAQGTLLHMISNMPSAMESFMPSHIGNPFKPSILALPGAMDEPLPIKLLGSLFGA